MKPVISVHAALVAVMLVSLDESHGARASTDLTNFQINGSFEYATNPDIPDYWAGTGRFYRSNGLPWEMCDAEGIKEFREKFKLDLSTAFHGKNSICIQRPFHLLGMPMAFPVNAACTVSFYMKSENPDRKVKIAVTEHDTQALDGVQIVTVGREWTRYQIHFDKYSHAAISLFVAPQDSGKVWIDAVQIEAAKEATPFVPCRFDQGFTLPQPVVHPQPGSDAIPELKLGAPLATPPVLDGDVGDSAWASVPSVLMRDYMGVPATVETRATIAYDKSNLYLMFVCADPGQAHGLGDSIEIFIDALGIGDPYYQFIFDAQGTTHNYRSMRGLHEWTWQADWRVAVKRDKARWTAEVAIPFASLPDAADILKTRQLRMNVGRNYAPGPEKYLSWVPVKVGFLEPDRFGRVILGDDSMSVAIPSIGLAVERSADSLFTLNFTARSELPATQRITASVGVEEQGEAAQFKTMQFELTPGKAQPVAVPGFKLKNLRCRASIILTDSEGAALKHLRTFLDVPHPIRLYSEYSYYTDEKEARVVVEFSKAGPSPKDGCLVLTLKLAGYPTTLVEKRFPLVVRGGRQVFALPIDALRTGHIYDVEARVFGSTGETVSQAKAKLYKHASHDPEVKVNRINRGIYLNGEPYIPYGILTGYFGRSQLQYYKKCGFDFISFVSNWNTPEQGLEFLSNCEQAGINAIAFHVARPNRLSPPEAANVFRDSRRLIGFIPNDEEADRQVYDIADRNKITYPQILNWINHNFTSYMAFENRLEGFPGDVLSIDRYPLLALPNGRPHTTSEIYSVERCAELMDRDGQRERMPLFFWLQAGERFSKEPTPRELTWLTFILLVNHCTGFTYFGGMPTSLYVWERMMSLNKEVQALKPYLFSLEDEPEIRFGNDDSRNYIRVLPKVLGQELVLVCVNRAMSPVDAAIDLAGIDGVKPGSGVVMFEGRAIGTGKDKVLHERFEPLSRHVYKFNLERGE